MNRNLKSKGHPLGATDKPISDLGNIGIGEFWLFFGADLGDAKFGRWIGGYHASPNGFVTNKAEHAQLQLRGIVDCIPCSPSHIIHAIPVLEFLRAVDSALSQITGDVVPGVGDPLPAGRVFGDVSGLEISGDPAAPEIPVRPPAVLLKARLVAFCSGLAGMCRKCMAKRPERFTAPLPVSGFELEHPEGGLGISVEAGHPKTPTRSNKVVQKKQRAPRKAQ